MRMGASGKMCIRVIQNKPNTTTYCMAFINVCLARSCCPAPTFCADMAETVESIADGTIKSSPINFSTMPTAAASSSPRILAMMAIRIKETCIKPSCSATGKPIFKMSESMFLCGLRSVALRSNTSLCRLIAMKAKSTLMVCERVVPKPAPIAPSPMYPINR